MQNILSQIISARTVILQLSLFELKIRYRGTFLGFVWSVVEPLAQLGVLYLIFSSIRSEREDFLPYLFIGLIIIHFFNRSTTQSLNSIKSKKAILTSFNVPKIIFPYSVVLTNLYMFFIEMGIFAFFIIFLQTEISWSILIFPVIILLIILLTTGISLILSVARLFFKDIQSIWSIVTLSLLFVSPVFWRVEQMQENIAGILLLNPLAALIELAHVTILGTSNMNYFDLIYSSVFSIAILFVGIVVFNKFQRKVVELI